MIVQRILIPAFCLFVLAGCAAPLEQRSTDDGGRGKEKASKVDMKTTSKLVLNGEVVDQSGTTAEPEADEPLLSASKTSVPKKDPKPKASAGNFVAAKPVKPPLYDDGTLYDGDDPFATDRAVAMPVPIERNPDTTKEVDSFAKGLRGQDGEEWQQWINDRSPMARASGPEDMLAPMVRIYTERCGGAKSYSTGIVIDDEMVATTVTAIESPQRRVRVSPLTRQGERLAGMIRYLDVDDDIAIIHVPGLVQEPMLMYDDFGDEGAQRGLAVGAATGGTQGQFQKVPVFVATRTDELDDGQRDGLGKKISGRPAFASAGPIDTGMAGGAVITSRDPNKVGNWDFQGMIRARVPYRSVGGGIAVPKLLLGEAIRAALKLPEWYEMRPSNCPQWYRPYKGATTIR